MPTQLPPMQVLREFSDWLHQWADYVAGQSLSLDAGSLTSEGDAGDPSGRRYGTGDGAAPGHPGASFAGDALGSGPPAHWLEKAHPGPPAHWLALFQETDDMQDASASAQPAQAAPSPVPDLRPALAAWLRQVQEGAGYYLAALGMDVDESDEQDVPAQPLPPRILSPETGAISPLPAVQDTAGWSDPDLLTDRTSPPAPGSRAQTPQNLERLPDAPFSEPGDATNTMPAQPGLKPAALQPAAGQAAPIRRTILRPPWSGDQAQPREKTLAGSAPADPVAPSEQTPSVQAGTAKLPDLALRSEPVETPQPFPTPNADRHRVRSGSAEQDYSSPSDSPAAAVQTAVPLDLPPHQPTLTPFSPKAAPGQEMEKVTPPSRMDAVQEHLESAPARAPRQVTRLRLGMPPSPTFPAQPPTQPLPNVPDAQPLVTLTAPPAPAAPQLSEIASAEQMPVHTALGEPGVPDAGAAAPPLSAPQPPVELAWPLPPPKDGSGDQAAPADVDGFFPPRPSQSAPQERTWPKRSSDQLWPELPQPQPVLQRNLHRTGDASRRQRLDREQRGKSWNG